MDAFTSANAALINLQMFFFGVFWRRYVLGVLIENSAIYGI